MNEQKALALTDPKEILEAAKEAETRNCEESIIRQLWKNYFAAVEKERSK